MEWRNGNPSATKVETEQAIVIKILHSNCTFPTGTAGFVRFEKNTPISICYFDMRWVETDPILGTRFFGHVLAHEIAHVLQQIARHSETGLMQARWTWEDCKRMTGSLLPFEEADIQLIRRGLLYRAERRRDYEIAHFQR